MNYKNKKPDKDYKLKTLGDVRAYLSGLINDARSGRYPVADASKIANMCRILMDCLKTQELDKIAEEVAKIKAVIDVKS